VAPADDGAEPEFGPPFHPAIGRAKFSTIDSRVPTLLVRDDAGNSMSPSSDFGKLAFLPSTPEADTRPSPEFGPPSPEFGPPSPDELDAMPLIPWSREYSYVGVISGSGTTAIRIPVSPLTRSLTLGLKPGREGAPFTPRVDQVSLFGRGGEVLSHIQGVSFLGDGDAQVLYISIHGAPIGGEIVVRLAPSLLWGTTPPNGEEPDGTFVGGGEGYEEVDGEGTSPPWVGTYFELSVARNDASGRSEGTAGVAGGAYVASFGQADGPSSIGPLEATTGTPRIAPSSGWGPRVAVAQATVRRDVDIDPADDGPVEVFLGPLVSRTAAALGPALATASGDPTQATDRASGSRSGVSAALGVGLDRGSTQVVEADAQADLLLAAMRGPGGVPILVAGLRAGEEAPEAEALAASAVGAAQEAAPPGDPVRPEGEAEVARAGLVGRALGLLVGMGLASGPLYPDLVALARRKFRRKPPRRRRARPADGRLNAGRG
jgi:hypothetical protein